MKSNNIAKFNFYFPEIKTQIKNKQELVDLLIDLMRKDGSIKSAGYFKEKDFQDDLSRNIGNGIITPLNSPNEDKKQKLEQRINSILTDCHEALPHPDLPIFIFVYPWFPNSAEQRDFEGSTAFAAYYTMHLFIDLTNYTLKSLNKTIAHEWNHLVFYRYHLEYPYTLRTYIIMEGLAEVFREELMNGGKAPWSMALTETNATEQLRLLEDILDTKGMGIYREIFQGNKQFKRWTGYSIGYWVAKRFRKQNSKLSWGDILKTKSEEIIKKGHNDDEIVMPMCAE